MPARGLLLMSLALGAAGADANPASIWDFARDITGWSSRTATLAVEWARDAGPTPSCRTSLHLHGSSASGFNYVISEPRPLQAGRLYRLSAWLRLERLAPGTPPPYLKCEFTAATRQAEPGRIATTRYETRGMGTWQQLSAEFALPSGAVGGWLALEKGTAGRTELEAWLADVRLEPIARYSALARYCLDPLPTALAERRGVHPRLYLDQARCAALRDAITTTHAALWQELRRLTDRLAAGGPPPYREHDASGDEQLYQREVGNAMPALAMAWRLSGERRYLDAARTFALASCAYPTWGWGQLDGMDLAAGHQLFGLALVYDWCGGELDEAARGTIRATLRQRGTAMFEMGATGKAWWGAAYLQNHLWVNACGLAAAGLALYDEVPEATSWIAFAQDKFRRTMEALGPDGASHEGVGYWAYGVEYLLKFMQLSRELLGVDLYDRDWWRNTAAYRLYLSLPRRSWSRNNCVVDIADCPRSNWYGPDYLLRGLAREYRDGHAQWLAAQSDEAGVCEPAASWLNLLWFDPALAAHDPSDLPTLRHFTDLGLVSCRSGWSGDESLVVFKCGPYIGHEAVQRFDHDPGGGHVHPDANQVVLFGAGEWLLRDDGYRTKSTGQHNTLLVDGHGQLGEGGMWFDGAAQLALHARPRVLAATSSPGLDHVAGDATEAYPRDGGLRRYVRHLLFMKPDALVVVDEVDLDRERPVELRFHTERRLDRLADGVGLVRGGTAALRLELLTRDGVAMTAEDIATEGQHGRTADSLPTLRLRSRQARWRNAMAFSWSACDREPPQVSCVSGATVWRFTVGDRTVELDLAQGRAGTVPAPAAR